MTATHIAGYLELGAGDAATWVVVMRGGVLGGQCRTIERAFGPAGSVSLTN
jgi:hypothetical protein